MDDAVNLGLADFGAQCFFEKVKRFGFEHCKSHVGSAAVY
jgi:hypothetical protein